MDRFTMFDSRLALWVKISADDIMKYVVLIFPRKQILKISCKLSHMDLHEMPNPVFWGKIRENATNVSSAELAQSVVESCIAY